MHPGKSSPFTMKTNVEVLVRSINVFSTPA
jgi:hypothetical protein